MNDRRLSDAGHLINQQSYEQSQRLLCGVFLERPLLDDSRCGCYSHNCRSAQRPLSSRVKDASDPERAVAYVQSGHSTSEFTGLITIGGRVIRNLWLMLTASYPWPVASLIAIFSCPGSRIQRRSPPCCPAIKHPCALQGIVRWSRCGMSEAALRGLQAWRRESLGRLTCSGNSAPRRPAAAASRCSGPGP